MALGISEFQPAPLDGSLSLPEVFDYTADRNLTRTYCLLAPVGHHNGGPIPTVTWLDLGRAMHRGAHLLNPLKGGSSNSIGSGKILAILAIADTLVYTATFMAIIRSGNIVSVNFLPSCSTRLIPRQPFPVSPRVSAAGIANLLRTTGCHHILSSAGSLMSKAISEVKADLGSNYQLNTLAMPVLAQLFPHLSQPSSLDFTDEIPPSERYPAVKHFKQQLPITYIHSSGSTGLPKAIMYTQAHVFNTMQMRELFIPFSYSLKKTKIIFFRRYTRPFSGGPDNSWRTCTTPVSRHGDILSRQLSYFYRNDHSPLGTY